MIRFTVDSVSDDTFMVYVVRFTIHEDYSSFECMIWSQKLKKRKTVNNGKDTEKQRKTIELIPPCGLKFVDTTV